MHYIFCAISFLCLTFCVLHLLSCFLPSPYILCVASLALSLAFALCLVRCISCLVSYLWFVSCALCLSPCLLPLPYVLCITSFASSLAFTLCLMHCVSRLVSRLSEFHSCFNEVDLLVFSHFCLVPYALHLLPRLSLLCFILCNVSLASSLALCLMHCIFHLASRSWDFHSHLSIVDLLLFSYNIVSLDKQSYVELTANKYRCFIWCRWVSCVLRLCLVFCMLCLSPSPYILNVMSLALSLTLSLALSLALFFALSLIRFSLSLRCSKSACCFSLYYKS